MNYLGIDYGTKRIGLAVAEAGIAFPIEAATQPDEATRLQHLEAVIQAKRVQALVVGLPLNEDGTAGPMAAAAEQFAKDLEKRFNLPVYRQDEYGSSQAADAQAPVGKTRHGVRQRQTERQSGTRDSRAAAIILQDFLDAQASPTE
ncbi:MAG: Holliday junction resolvase RuvX [Opitutales bacterium]